MDLTCEANDSPDGEGSSRRGRLSKRMLKEGVILLSFSVLEVSILLMLITSVSMVL